MFYKYNVSYTNKNICIFGRSNLIGLPLYLLLLHYNNTIYNIHPFSNNVKEFTKNADIILSAMGQPLYIDKSFLNPYRNQVLIDIGVNYILKDGVYKCVGDINYSNVIHSCDAITPVPGGIGPITINMLMYNTIKAAYIYSNHLDLWNKVSNGHFIHIDNLNIFQSGFKP
ncbi:hypothetical protein WA158_001523 [Blastocystis sp. Blastoise]